MTIRMRIAAALTAVVALVGLGAGAQVVTAVPAAATTTQYYTSEACHPVQSSKYTLVVIANWVRNNANGAVYLLSSEQVYILSATGATYNWGASQTLYDKTGSSVLKKIGPVDPVGDDTRFWNDAYTSPAYNRHLHYNVSGSPGGVFVSCIGDLYAA